MNFIYTLLPVYLNADNLFKVYNRTKYVQNMHRICTLVRNCDRKIIPSDAVYIPPRDLQIPAGILIFVVEYYLGHYRF